MVATNLKSETLKLMEKRSGVEAEMNVIIERLCRPGGPGLSGNLLDSEGFPRTNIDIPAVRAERHKLAELRNDHKDIMEKINRNIQLLHSAKLTPTAASVKDSGKLLQATRPHLYWTPCAAHCIDLIMEDIGKLSVFKTTLKNAMSMNAYIYVRPSVVHLLREFTGQRELVRAGVTRFATVYLTLTRMHKQKHNLKKMFLSEEWTSSKGAKEVVGKNIAKIILTPRFWSNIIYILKIYGPLVRVLRIVDGEKRPAMGYIYMKLWIGLKKLL